MLDGLVESQLNVFGLVVASTPMRLITAGLHLVDKAIVALVTLGMILSGGLIFVLAIVGGLDVVSTTLFRKPIPIVSEVSADSLAVIIFMAIGYAQYQRGHIVVDIVTERMPRTVQKILEFMAIVVGVAFIGVLALQAGELALESLLFRESAMALIPYPVYPFKIAFLAGLAVAAAEFLRQAVWMVITGATGAANHQQSTEITKF